MSSSSSNSDSEDDDPNQMHIYARRARIIYQVIQASIVIHNLLNESFVILFFVYIGTITSTSMVLLYFYSHLQVLVA